MKLLQLEIRILKDELDFAFRNLVNKQYQPSGLCSILKITLLEYPKKLLHSDKQYLFLDYLNLMLLDRTELYKMFCNVTYASSSPLVVHWVLAICAFALKSIWHAVMKVSWTFAAC